MYVSYQCQTDGDIKKTSNTELYISGLDSGFYENIVVTEITTGCLVDLGNVELQCIPPEKACFASKNFFTANGMELMIFGV